jgi:hypothetical protein
VSEYQPSPPPATPYVPAGGAAPQRSPLLSILALVAGILGLIFAIFFWWIPFVGAIIALLVSAAGVVLGHLGQRRERSARGFWLTGLITGYIGVGLSLLALIGWIALAIFAAAQHS